MRRLIFSPKAAADIDEIWDYTAQRWGIDQAEKYVGTIREFCLALAREQKFGQDAMSIRPGYRRQECGSHVIFYRLASDDLVEIVRILHQRMDFPRHL